ncbi:mRNA degradation protein [Ceratobasidium sp. AG-Ba]|nr:mRNA degradation protein [Ceratobasidium sp. AG-Ba]QRW15033.1 mRNA degradation protein [Ceratobasidium sp. AG-Ba]
MPAQLTFPVGAQVWARMPEPLRPTQSVAQSDTEVLSWIVGYERRGAVLYYSCKAPESGGIWTFNDSEVVSGVSSVRPALTHGAQFELNQNVRIKKRVEWQHTEGGQMQKSGCIKAAWCKQVQSAGGYFLDYSYWVEVDNKDHMQQAAVSAGRNLRSALDTRILTANSWGHPSNSGLSNLSRNKNKDLSQLSSRLSQRLSPAVSNQSTSRTISTRTKKRRLKKPDTKIGLSLARPRKSSAPNIAETQPEWTAVSSALTTLEESIARTNLLLHSLASGEAWARRTRSPRLTWDTKAALDSTADPKRDDSIHTVDSLTTLLQELGQKQAVAADLLSRLNRSTSSALPAPPSPRKTFEELLANKTIKVSDEPSVNSKQIFETGWGNDVLRPPARENPATHPTPLLSLNASDENSSSHAGASTETLQGIIKPDAVSLESAVRDPSHVVPIPTLQHGLDRVLFNPGVHWLQDPHSRVYNFPPELQAMPAFTSFSYEKVNSFVTSSKDAELAELARRLGKKFTGSTSSVSMILSHIYFLISGWREIDLSVLSTSFAHMPNEFTSGQKMPYTFFMRRNDDVVAFDSGSQADDPLDQNILSYIGVMLEKLLTLPREDFDTLLQKSPTALENESVLPEREAYRYSTSNSMVLRSQLDCVDSRLPGSGIFDLKTRAAISVRQDVWNVEIGSGYQIRSLTGPFESFEREYYDLCRSALLKYSFQARIGDMDGVFVAYHNTSRMFGFQYIPLEEMDERLFGGHEGGERAFKACLGFLEVIAENVTSCFPEQDVKAMVYTNETKEPELSVWVEPVAWSEPTPAPVYEFRLSVNHAVNGEPVPPGARVTFDNPEWKISYTLTRLPPCPENRARYNKAFARQQAIRVACLPEGTTIEELSNRMKGGVLEGYATRSLDGSDTSAEPEGDGVTSSTLDAWNRRFRKGATPLVRSLRGLSKKGLEDLNKWAKDDSPKIVYKPRT